MTVLSPLHSIRVRVMRVVASWEVHCVSYFTSLSTITPSLLKSKLRPLDISEQRKTTEIGSGRTTFFNSDPSDFKYPFHSNHMSLH